MKSRTVQTFCQHCHMKCRLFVRVRDNRIESVVNGMGVRDPKSMHLQELVYHPDRVVYPRKRVGPRGGGRWERISWEEALGLMAERFGRIRTEHGPEALAVALGCGHKDAAFVASFLFSYLLGTPNVMDINYLCHLPGRLAEAVTFGLTLMADIGVDYQSSRCILIWGGNPKHCRPPQERALNAAQARGAKLIVVDPRPPDRADPEVPPADLWLRLRPGTDAALALGMINLIIKEELFDREFVAQWCVGFAELRARAAQYSLDKVAEITWVSPEEIAQAARWFARTKPACLHARLGPNSQQINATQTARTLCLLLALTGNIDQPGGNLVSDLKDFLYSNKIWSALRLPPEVEKKRLGAREFPLISGPTARWPRFVHAHNPTCLKAMLQGELKAIYVPGSNLVLSELDSRKTWAALEAVEFSVVVDLFMTPTAELADLVLPAAHFLETEIPLRAYQDMGPEKANYILAPRKVIAPVGECWDDRKIVLELAKKMGLEPPWSEVNEFNDWMLAGVGVRFREIQARKNQQLAFPLRYRKYEKEGFATPSRKVELYSSLFEDFGYDPLPSYQEPPESPVSRPDLAAEYPFLLINHRHKAYMHSEFRQLPSVRQEVPHPVIEINPEAAQALGLAEGEEVFIERPGFAWRVKGRARLVPGLHPRVVSCLAQWWFPEEPGPEHGCFVSNINTIISNDPPYDPLQGNPQVRGLLCRIVPA